MKRQLLLIVALCSLGVAHGSTAIKKLLSEYQTARGARKEAIAEEVQRKYGLLAEKYQQKILRKIKMVGIDVEGPQTVLRLIQQYRRAPDAKQARIREDIRDLLNQVKPATRDRIAKYLRNAGVRLAPPVPALPVKPAAPAKPAVVPRPAEAPVAVPEPAEVLVPAEELELEAEEAEELKLEPEEAEEEEPPKPVGYPELYDEEGPAAEAAEEAEEAEEVVKSQDITDWVEGIRNLEFKIRKEGLRPDILLRKAGIEASEVSLQRVGRGDADHAQLLDLLDLGTRSDGELQHLINEIYDRIVVVPDPAYGLPPLVGGLLSIAKRLDHEHQAAFVNFGKLFVQALRKDKDTTLIDEAVLSTADAEFDKLLEERAEEPTPAEAEEDEEEKEEEEPAAEAEVAEEPEPAAAIAFEVSSENVLSVSVGGVKHNTADEGGLRNLVAALARVSDDDVRNLGARIAGSQADGVTHDMLIEDDRLFDKIDSIKDTLSDAEKQTLRELIDAIIATIKDKATREGVQGMAPTL